MFGSSALAPSKSHDQPDSDSNADDQSHDEPHFCDVCVIAKCGCVSEIMTRETLEIQSHLVDWHME